MCCSFLLDQSYRINLSQRFETFTGPICGRSWGTEKIPLFLLDQSYRINLSQRFETFTGPICGRSWGTEKIPLFLLDQLCLPVMGIKERYLT